MVALFGPVQAAAHEIAGLGVDAELGERGCAVLADGVAGRIEDSACGAMAGHVVVVGAAVAVGEDSLPAERVCDSDAEPAGEVVVAASGIADRVRPCSLSQRGDRLCRGYTGDGFDQLTDTRAGESEVSVPAAAGGGDEACLDEFGEVMARGGCRDTGFGRENGCCERPAVGKRQEHLRPGRLSEHRAHGGHVGVPDWLQDPWGDST